MPTPADGPAESPEPGHPEPGQDEARQRFIGTFGAQWESLRVLVGQIAADGPGGPGATVVEMTMRLSELALSIGFPTVSLRAAELAELAAGAATGVFERLRAQVVMDAMMEAFTKDFATAPRAQVVITAEGAPPVAALPSAAITDDGEAPLAVAVRTAVIADDDPDVTRIVDAHMRAAGYETILAFDGEEALAAVRANHPDVLVLAVMMPKLSGFDVLMALRDGPAPRPRTIVLSALAREGDTLRAFELGADDYMTKPFNPQELIARFARLLK